MEKVIFDTNFVRNVEPRKFLGGRNELERFSKVAELVFPDIVIEEIKNQKRKNLEKHKNSFIGNPFHWLKKLDVNETKKFNIESHLQELEMNEAIKYKVITLTDHSVLNKIKDLALRKLPPFEAADNTDKGFKDACIYFTTLEYLQSIPDKMIFVCCKDGRLKEAFDKHLNITVIESFDEFLSNSITVFYDDYFIQKLKSEVNVDILLEGIIDSWININDNRVLLIEVKDEIIVVEVDSREIITTGKTTDYFKSIDNLINSESFTLTHNSIDELEPYSQFLSDEEILKILEASIDNNQIRRILSDRDVKEFISLLYDKKKRLLSNEQSDIIKQILQ